MRPNALLYCRSLNSAARPMSTDKSNAPEWTEKDIASTNFPNESLFIIH